MSDPQTTRRGFLGWLWAGLGVVALGELVWVGLTFLRPRRKSGEDVPELLVCGPVEDFAPGTVTAFPAGRFYLARLQDGGFLAMHRECTHLNCTVPWSQADERFICPCHASTFDITGQVLSAPAPRPLDLLAVRVENGLVKVNPQKRTRRSAYRPEQVVHA